MDLFDDEPVAWMNEPQSEVDAADVMIAFECISLEEAGLEEGEREVIFGAPHGVDGAIEVVAWWSDGEDARDWLTQ